MTKPPDSPESRSDGDRSGDLEVAEEGGPRGEGDDQVDHHASSSSPSSGRPRRTAGRRPGPGGSAIPSGTWSGRIPGPEDGPGEVRRRRGRRPVVARRFGLGRGDCPAEGIEPRRFGPVPLRHDADPVFSPPPSSRARSRHSPHSGSKRLATSRGGCWRLPTAFRTIRRRTPGHLKGAGLGMGPAVSPLMPLFILGPPVPRTLGGGPAGCGCVGLDDDRRRRVAPGRHVA